MSIRGLMRTISSERSRVVGAESAPRKKIAPPNCSAGRPRSYLIRFQTLGCELPESILSS
jgi:hypothetical protein